MTIGNYVNIPQLPGVQHDARNALDLARAIGYDTTDARIFREEQLNGDGIRRAVADTTSRVRAGDRLFMYYSGHGASFPVNGGCAEALVPHDATGDPSLYVRTGDLITLLDQVRHLLTDAFVFFDACHSGGHREIVASGGKGSMRAASDAPALISKSYVPRGGELCFQVANKSALGQYVPAATAAGSTRGLSLGSKAQFTFVAAARENEEALDRPGRGGVATSALLQCAQQGVASARGTGIANVMELQACAQALINDVVPRISSTHKAHTLEIYANGFKTLPSVPLLAPSAGHAPVDEAQRTINVFEQIAANANPNHGFSVVVSRERVALGGRSSVYFSSSVRGFVTILYVGSDRKDITALATNLPIAAVSGQLLGEITIKPPQGENTFLVMMTPERLDSSTLLNAARDGKALPLSAAISQELACEAETKRNASFQAGTPCSLRNATFASASSLQSLGVAGAPISGGQAGGYGAVVLRVTGY